MPTRPRKATIRDVSIDAFLRHYERITVMNAFTFNRRQWMINMSRLRGYDREGVLASEKERESGMQIVLYKDIGHAPSTILRKGTMSLKVTLYK